MSYLNLTARKVFIPEYILIHMNKKNKRIRMKSSKKRVNITVDKTLLDEAKKKLGMFGGKLSTLFNAYLSDFVKSIEKNTGKSREDLTKRIKDLESRIKKLEDKLKS